MDLKIYLPMRIFFCKQKLSTAITNELIPFWFDKAQTKLTRYSNAACLDVHKKPVKMGDVPVGLRPSGQWSLRFLLIFKSAVSINFKALNP